MTSQLKTIVDLATKTWQSHTQIIQFLVRVQNSSPSPELRYTWVQEPVNFGRCTRSRYPNSVGVQLGSKRLPLHRYEALLNFRRNWKPLFWTNSRLVQVIRRCWLVSMNCSTLSIVPKLFPHPKLRAWFRE